MGMSSQSGTLVTFIMECNTSITKEVVRIIGSWILYKLEFNDFFVMLRDVYYP